MSACCGRRQPVGSEGDSPCLSIHTLVRKAGKARRWEGNPEREAEQTRRKRKENK